MICVEEHVWQKAALAGARLFCRQGQEPPPGSGLPFSCHAHGPGLSILSEEGTRVIVLDLRATILCAKSGPVDPGIMLGLPRAFSELLRS